MVIGRPLAPVVAPVIISPLVNAPVIVPTVKVGATASTLVSPESKTPTNSNASDLPKDISLSSGRVPYASVAPVETLSCFISLVVFDFCVTEVLRIVAVSTTFAESPKIVLSVIVRVTVPAPEAVSTILTG